MDQALVRTHAAAVVVLAAACLVGLGGATTRARTSPLERSLASADASTRAGSDPLLAGQWYLNAVHAFDFWPVPAPSLASVRVAVLDSGIDGGHPDFQGRVAASRSFVGGSPLQDEIGHGTMVAGEILAAVGERANGQATAAPVELLIGKIVAGDGTIDVGAEARAIRWAVDEGARVINLSLGARRDPKDPTLDEYSPVEDAAVQYAYRRGALVVAATGNCADVCPYRFASYPAALDHVLAVSAFAENGTTPIFSNRDQRRNDLAAPGVGIVSTFPIDLSMAGCAEPGYSICASAPDERKGDGTSFAAPLATAGAALLFAIQPALTPSQAMSILERAADPTAGEGHNAKTGYGHLDIAKALQALAGPLPPPNSPTGLAASTGVFRLGGVQNVVRATLDYYDDPLDVYAMHARSGERLTATVSGQVADGAVLRLLAPRTKDIRTVSQRQLTGSLIAGAGPAPIASIRYRTRVAGWYYLELRAVAELSGSYRLVVVVSRSRSVRP